MTERYWFNCRSLEGLTVGSSGRSITALTRRDTVGSAAGHQSATFKERRSLSLWGIPRRALFARPILMTKVASLAPRAGARAAGASRPSKSQVASRSYARAWGEGLARADCHKVTRPHLPLACIVDIGFDFDEVFPMGRRPVAWSLVALATTVILIGRAEAWSIFSLFHLVDEATINYRMDVEIDLDDKSYHGSGVQGLHGEAEIRSLPGTGGGISPSLLGEAVVINIPGQKSLYFTMVTRNGSSTMASVILADCHLNNGNPDPVRRLDTLRDFEGPCDLTHSEGPMVVQFGDESDVNTVTPIVLPTTLSDGRTMRVRSVTIRRTKDPISFELSDRLPWLDRLKGPESVFVVHLDNGDIYANTSIFREGK